MAMSYANIGSVYDSQGKYEEALVQHQKALQVFLAVYGQEHPNVADSYQNIGMLYQQQGNESAATEIVGIHGPTVPNTVTD